MLSNGIHLDTRTYLPGATQEHPLTIEAVSFDICGGVSPVAGSFGCCAARLANHTVRATGCRLLCKGITKIASVVVEPTPTWHHDPRLGNPSQLATACQAPSVRANACHGSCECMATGSFAVGSRFCSVAGSLGWVGDLVAHSNKIGGCIRLQTTQMRSLSRSPG